jgi:hypothetical protein
MTIAATIDLETLHEGGARVIGLDVDQYHWMIRTGILPEGAPIELIDGALVLKDRAARGGPPMSIFPGHSTGVKKIDRLDPALAKFGLMTRTQQPVTLPPRGEPEPDGVIVRGPVERFGERHPGPGDICVVIEVADSSLGYDRRTKARMYATAGIPQYVITNLVDDVIEVYADPDPIAGTYAAPAIVPRDGVVTFKLFDGQTLNVPAADLLP